MNGKQVLGLVAALIVSVPAFAAADQYLYDDGSLTAQGVTAVQQHTVYVEIIQEDVNTDVNENIQEQIHQFAAVVALVKRCLNQNNVERNAQTFDNAVLWFNDQFLFGDKAQSDEEAAVNYNYTEGPVLGNASNDGWGQPPEDAQDANGFYTIDTDGSAKFIRRYGDATPGRWVGCFIPEGFLHAIGSDDPVATGASPAPGLDNIGLVKDLIDLDNHPDCNGCVFNYSGSFYITDPNGKNWLIDKYVYPAVVSGATGAQDCGGDTNIHFSGLSPAASGCEAEQHRDTADDVSDPNNHCYNNTATTDTCDANGNDPSDTPRRESTKLTTLEPLYTVHLQVDTDYQSIRDEALWAWDSGTTRPGQPRYEDNADGFCAADNTDARCSIEYNALIVVDFEAFDDVGVLFGGEDEIERNGKLHGDGGADNLTDESLAGNSHNANPNAGPGNPAHTHDTVSLDLFFMYHRATDCDAYKTGPAITANPTGGQYQDIVTACGAPHFTIVNDAFSTSDFGAPPVPTSADCTGAPALDARVFIVCDVDDDAGEFHAHDGSQTIG